MLDVNECATNNGGCSHTCINTIGSFVCSCMAGYTLGADSRSCNGKQFVDLIQHFIIMYARRQ